MNLIKLRHTQLFLLCLASPLLSLGRCIAGPPPVEAWVQRYHQSTTGGSSAEALALDATGNVYVAGNADVAPAGAAGIVLAYGSNGTPLWTNIYRSSSNSFDNIAAIAADSQYERVYLVCEGFATVAYSKDGLPLWTNRYRDPGFIGASPSALAVGADGNVYVGGNVGGMSERYATVAYSASGAPLWTNVALRGSVEAMALDQQNDVIVTGIAYSGNGVGFGTIGYSSNGIPLWTNFYYGPASPAADEAYALAADKSRGRVFVSGVSTGVGTAFDLVTVAYSSAGTALWTNRYNGPGNDTDEPAAVTVDTNSGNLYVVGDSYNVNGYFDALAIGYSGSGTPLWTNRFNATGNHDSSAGAVAVDRLGNVIVSAWTTRNGTGLDFATIAYSSSGVPLWTNYYDGPLHCNDSPGALSCLAIASDGGIYVTGASQGLDDGITNWDFATIKYVPAPDIRFAAINRLADSSSLLWIEAPSNTPYRLEASTNLAGWTPLTNFPALPVTSLQFTDTLAPNFPSRFYRTVWSP